MFIGRVEELDALKSRLDSEVFELIVVYGRRRLGKTTLIYEAVKDRNPIFYTGSKNNNIGKFRKAANLEHLVEDWEVLLGSLKDRIIVLDEFPYIVEDDSAIGNELQKVIDHAYRNSKTKLIVCGSIISILKENLLEHASPLYGRKTAQMKLKPIRFVEMKGFYSSASFGDLVKAYAFSGGIPQYSRLVSFPFETWFESEVAREDSIIVDEVEFLIKSEFKKERAYFSILEAISCGKNTFSEIKNHGKFRETDITPYLSNLKYVELIDVAHPLFEGKKNTRYVIKDNFVRFWFNFVYPKMFEIEIRKYKLGKPAFNTYLGHIFEEVMLQLFSAESFTRAIGFSPDRFGKQWGKIPAQLKPEKGKEEYEIDIVALDEKRSSILFAECKWQDGVNAATIAKELAAKIPFVEWRNGQRNERLAIFARSFSKRIAEFEGRQVVCLDLIDLSKML